MSNDEVWLDHQAHFDLDALLMLPYTWPSQDTLLGRFLSGLIIAEGDAALALLILQNPNSGFIYGPGRFKYILDYGFYYCRACHSVVQALPDNHYARNEREGPIRAHVDGCGVWAKLDEIASRLLFRTLNELSVALDKLLEEGVLK